MDPATEDEWMPRLLTAGLKSLVLGAGAAATPSPLPSCKMPHLHARLRLTLDEKRDDEDQWGFRGIATDNAISAQARIRAARREVNLKAGSDQRKLILIRDTNWPKGTRMNQTREAFLNDGGITMLISIDDLRTFSALHEMLTDPTPSLIEWLRTKRPASNSEVLGTVVADIREIVTDDTQAPSGGEQDSELEPAGPHVSIGSRTRTGGPFDVDLEALRKHAAVFAGSGSGKTVLIRRLVEECALQGVSSIVLDPNNDLARLGDPWPQPPAGRGGRDDARRPRDYLPTPMSWSGRRDGSRACR